MNIHPFLFISIPVFGALVAGCSKPPEASWFPLDTGASWTYDVTTDTDGVVRQGRQTVTVTGSSQRDGKPTVTRRSETTGNIGIEYLLQVAPDAITRIAQRTDLQAFPIADEKPRTVMTLPLQIGSTWSTPTVPYAVMRKAEHPRELKYGKPLQMTYVVESLTDKVEVPAGRFSGCARVVGRADLTLYADPVKGFRKTPITTTEWYCPGVGMVKLLRTEPLETSFFTGGRIEMVLADYRMP